MPTMRLVPSTIYNAAGTSYLTVSNPANAYTDTDSDTYATIQNTNASTSSRYIYIRGFNFDDLPNAAVVSSFTVKMKASQSGISTSTSYKPYLANGTSAINGTCDAIGTTAEVYTFTGLSADWDDIVGYGSNFGIRVNCRRSSRNTTGYMYIYGAEIEVTYTIPDPRTITSTLTGNGTISPSGSTTTYDGEEYEITITPVDLSETVTVTNNGTDVTSSLVGHGAESSLGVTPANVTTSSVQSGSSYASYAVGYSAENPSSSGTSSNMYASSGSTGYAEYSFDFSDIPAAATIENVEVRCYGHRESSTVSSTYVSKCVLYQSSTAISEEVEFPSTSNSIITLTPNSTPTRSDLDNITVRHYVGYYGGLVLGITFEVTYSTGSGITHYTYTFTVSGDAAVVVTIGSTATQDVLMVKLGGVWVPATNVYVKVNGSWTQQSNLTQIFQSGVNYIRRS